MNLVEPTGSDAPDWEAHASAGWWEVVYTPSVRCHEEPSTASKVTGVHCVGKLLAMKDRTTSEASVWLQLRDECGRTIGAPWLRETLGQDIVLLQPLPTGNGPPSAAARAVHMRAVAQVARAREKFLDIARANAEEVNMDVDLMATLMASEHVAAPSFSVGCPTAPHASASARDLLLRWGGTDVESSFIVRRLLRNRYVVIPHAWPEASATALMQEVACLDEEGHLREIPAQRTQGQRGDRILWVDEASAACTYRAPVTAAAIAFLKGLADALNPVLSRHHIECASAGDPAHAAPPVPPATPNAVLTVPPRAMLASYPGGGAGYIPHVDNKYHPGLRRRVNPRELTVILYANPPDWDVTRDGGALRLYQHSENLPAFPKVGERKAKGIMPVTVPPIGGCLVIFFSALWHEVLPAHRKRRAVTLWIFRPDVACG